MDLCIFSSVLSIMYSCILHTVLTAEAPAASAAAQEHHLRTKRCSCATFLDKECVYFCHLDIIWVNTPERVVSYGLGSAPRTKRAAAKSMATSSGPRCQCSRQRDNTCRSFCRLRLEPPEEQQPGAGPRMWKSATKPRWPPALWASSRTRLLLEKQRLRRGSASKPAGDGSPSPLPSNRGAPIWDQRQPR